MKKNKTKAFTLAEVLITLSIIGVVAAMTIPTLMSNVQKHQYVVGLKKFYTTQMSGWSTLLATEGVSQLEDTSVFQSMTGDSCMGANASTPDCSAFFNGLKKYFKFDIVTAPSYQIHFLNGGNYIPATGFPCFVFSDGTVALATESFVKVADKPTAAVLAGIDAGGYHMRSQQSDFLVDVNGFKKPNVMGRDIFWFYLSGDGKLYPQKGKDYDAFIGYAGSDWTSSSSDCGTKNSSDASTSMGYCAARVMEEGWQMNY